MSTVATTASTCPSFCDQHDAAMTDDGAVLVLHDGPVTQVAGTTVAVAVQRQDRLHLDASTAGRPEVALSVGNDSVTMTAEQARRTAAALLDAADLLG